MKRFSRWAFLGVAALAVVVAGDGPAFAWLEGGVQAMRSSAGQWVELKLTVDRDCLIKVVIGTNAITFAAKKGAELRTGRLRNSGDLVQVFRDGQLVCQIPVQRIPEGRFERFCYDKTPPMVRVTPSPGPNSHGWNNTTVTVTVTAEEEKDGSGVKAIFYKIGTSSPVEVGKDKLTVTEGGRVATFSLRISDEYTHYLGFWAVDEAGNESESRSLTVRIDTTRPTIGLSPSGGRYKGSVSISWSSSDAVSGLASCAVYVGPSRVSTSSSGSHTLSPGTHSVEVRAEDKAGNTASTSLSYTVYRPSFFQVTEVTASPSTIQVGQSSTISATINNIGDESGTRTVTFYVGDSPVGTRSLTLNPGASKTENLTYTFNTVGIHTVKVTADDTKSTTVRVEAKPARFEVTRVTASPVNPRVGERVTITYGIRNTGGSYGRQRVLLTVDGSTKDDAWHGLAAGESIISYFYYTFSTARTYDVTIRTDDHHASVSVRVTSPGSPPVILGACIEGVASSIGPGGTHYSCTIFVEFGDYDGDVTTLIVDGRSVDIRSQAYGRVSWFIRVTVTGSTPSRIQLRDAAGNLSQVVTLRMCYGH